MTVWMDAFMWTDTQGLRELKNMEYAGRAARSTECFSHCGSAKHEAVQDVLYK